MCVSTIDSSVAFTLKKDASPFKIFRLRLSERIKVEELLS